MGLGFYEVCGVERAYITTEDYPLRARWKLA